MDTTYTVTLAVTNDDLTVEDIPLHLFLTQQEAELMERSLNTEITATLNDGDQTIIEVTGIVKSVDVYQPEADIDLN